MRKYILFFSVVFFTINFVFGQVDDQIINTDGKNSKIQQDKPYVILISADGFRDDYFDVFNPKFLKKKRKKGVYTDFMIPSYPSITFPNHYTIVTGLVPSHHGLIGNSVYNRETKKRYSLGKRDEVTNPDWYGGVPIWSLAESQNMLSACLFWPGSEAKIAGHYPNYYYPYSENKTLEEKIKIVKNWLELPDEKRPHLITFYLPQIDQAGHQYYPEAYETGLMVNYVDYAIKQLEKEVKKTKVPVNFIFLSDHGMMEVNPKPIQFPEYDKKLVETGLTGVYVNLFVTDSTKIQEVYDFYKATENEQYKVYLKSEVPVKYEFAAKDDWKNRIGDVILIAEAPHYFTLYNRKPPRSSHGYHPTDIPEMNTVFFAWGPDFNKRTKVEPFQNIHIYPLLAELLGLEYAHQIDGDKRLVKDMLKKKK